MFESLRSRIDHALTGLRSDRKLSDKAIDETIREVRRALLEADVALPVVIEFVEQIRERASGSSVAGSLTVGQTILTIVHEELTKIIGKSNVPLDLSGPPPAVILVAGLQGSGKTTTVGKLAKLLKTENKIILVASVDVYRPAAIDQLQRLAEIVGVDFYETNASDKPTDIAAQAISRARQNLSDVVIIDTAGRLHIDQEMMDELKAVHKRIAPVETLFVIDAMTGQDAVTSAAAFDEALPLTGVIVTKLDSDARGGALLSVRKVTGKPVKYIGVGEGIDALERFHPDRISSRILGMGDVMSLLETVQQQTDQDKARILEQKIRRGKRFDLEDYRDQLLMARDMGGLSKIAKMLPGVPNTAMPKLYELDQSAKQEIAIINSMTPHERQFPAVIRGTRRSRISKGAGVEVRDVSQLLRKLEKIRKAARKMSRSKGKMPPMPGMENSPFS